MLKACTFNLPGYFIDKGGCTIQDFIQVPVDYTMQDVITGCKREGFVMFMVGDMRRFARVPGEGFDYWRMYEHE